MKSETGYKRIVVKIGSSSLTHEETGKLDLGKMEQLVRQLSDLRNRGMDVCLVSSGAIAVGRAAMGIHERPAEISMKQACAAVGQAKQPGRLDAENHRGQFDQQIPDQPVRVGALHCRGFLVFFIRLG